MEAYIICLVSLVILNRTSAELSGTLQIAPGPFSDTMISIFIGLDTFELFSRGLLNYFLVELFFHELPLTSTHNTLNTPE